MVTRSQLLADGARGAAGLAFGGSLAAYAAEPAAAADTEADLALVRLALSAEVLADAFYARASGSAAFSEGEQQALRAARFTEQRHYGVLVQSIGPGAPAPGDFAIDFPEGTFASRARTAALGVVLEKALVGAYLGAIDAFSSAELRARAARIVASEGMHLGFLSGLERGAPIGDPFPRALDIEGAANALAPFFG